METAFNFTPQAKKALFNLCRWKRYTTDQLIDAGNLLKKLKEGAEPVEKTIIDDTGEKIKVIIYKDFTLSPVTLTVEEYKIAQDTFKGIKEWSPSEEEIEIYLELKTLLKI